MLAINMKPGIAENSRFLYYETFNPCVNKLWQSLHLNFICTVLLGCAAKRPSACRTAGLMSRKNPEPYIKEKVAQNTGQKSFS